MIAGVPTPGPAGQRLLGAILLTSRSDIPVQEIYAL